VARANDPLACLLYVLARNAVPYGTIEAAVHKALSDNTPAMDADDPMVRWAIATAEEMRVPTS
jgi:hypothetical protein